MMCTTVKSPTTTNSSALQSAPQNEARDKSDSGDGEDFASLLSGSWFTLQEAAKPLNKNTEAPIDPQNSLFDATNAATTAGANQNLPLSSLTDMMVNQTSLPKETGEASLAAIQATAGENAPNIQVNQTELTNSTPANSIISTTQDESATVINQLRTDAQMAQTKADTSEKIFSKQLAETTDAAKQEIQTLKTLHSEAAQRDSATVASLLAEATRQVRPQFNAAALKPLLTERTLAALEPEKNPTETDSIEPANLNNAAFPDGTMPTALRHAMAGGGNSSNEAISNVAKEVVSQVAAPVMDFFEKMGNHESRTLNLRLHPDSLGQVDVQLTRDGKGGLSAHLTTDHDTARRALHEGINHLRETLEQAGVHVTRLDVSVGHGSSSFNSNQRGTTSESSPTSYLPATTSTTEVTPTHTAADPEDRVISLRA